MADQAGAGGVSPDALIADLEAAEGAARAALEAAVSSSGGADPQGAVEEIRVRFLGKKGEVSRILKSMGRLAGPDRPRVGQVANGVRDRIETALAEAREAAAGAALRAELEGPPVDVTLPGRPLTVGRRHPVTRARDELVEIFRRIGFDVATGPEIEGDYYNFEALCMPPDHPARDMQDTFYVEGAVAPLAETHDGQSGPKPGQGLLRTHTSPVQIRTMLRHRPPVRVVCPGKVYRRDSDVTHTPMFHQIEGLWVDRGVTLADLKGTLQLFGQACFGPGTEIRLRSSYFPFTEPSVEVDVSCTLCGGKGCRVCSGTGWLEILGAGMVDPGVFSAVGYDPEVYSGFAFGMGIDRVAMLKYGVDDLRSFFEDDARFLEQFP